MPGAEKSPGRCVMIEKGNTSFKKENAPARVSRGRCRASKSFVCVWGKVVNNR